VNSTETAHNRLIHETSPYLRKHAHNPVDWYPWGPEALERARSEDKPIFLSIGYSACHWCHVMERECFENAEIAALMNRRYVNIKVDREERPDIDEIYMKAVTALTGAGGWPMSVFLTPQLQPFFGATYLPPERMHGRPSFPDVLQGLADAYANERERVAEHARQLTAAIGEEAKLDTRGSLPPGVLDLSLQQFKRRFDSTWGGFGGAPKFPHAADLRLCLRHHRRTGEAEALHMATFTLATMMNGGIFDQLGGGFHRYSVDREWRVPHFEKMLYDNALLVPAYLEAFTLTGNVRYAEVARAACDWALREMQLPDGGFASAQDADSEGEEGRFFVWTKDELERVLGPERARVVAAYYDVSDAGNFEDGKSVLWMPRKSSEISDQLGMGVGELELAVAQAKPLLLAARGERVRPDTDDKVLTAWNGLMVSALAQAHQVLKEPRYLSAAVRCMSFVQGALRQPDAHVNAGLDEYAFVITALIDLYETTFERSYLSKALLFAELVEARFADATLGGYFTTGEGHEPLIARLKSTHDGALPSGAAVHALNLARLGALCSRPELQARALAACEALGAMAQRFPQAFSQLFIALDFMRQRPREVVIAGELDDPETGALLAAVRGSFRPQRVVALAHREADRVLVPMVEGKTPGPNGPRAFVCEEYRCLEPVDDAAGLLRELNA
jgi:uncharacterized protein YyaL (SSP411 family)